MLVKPKKYKQKIKEVENAFIEKDMQVIMLKDILENIEVEINKINFVMHDMSLKKMKRIHLFEMLAEYRALAIEIQNKIHDKGGVV